MILRVDFSALDDALRLMGAKPVEVDFSGPTRPIDPIDIELESGLTLPNLKDIETSSGLISYQGRQILLYIQDHGARVQDALEDGQIGNKFHVADCKVLKSMRAKGRYERYVVTNRLDGEFDIAGVDWQTQRLIEGKARLWVCRVCLKLLNYQGARYGDSYQQALNFDIGIFFSTYSSFFLYLPQRRAGNAKDEGYTSDWTEISSRYKADKNFLCESCGVDLGENRKLLHVHHRNGVKSDNRPKNLSALCVACHREQAQHEHMFVRHADMRTINRLRTEQGKFRVSSWDAVLKYCDRGLRDLLDACQREGAVEPEIGLDVQDRESAVIACLDIAWSRTRVGVAVNEADRVAAEAEGWRMWQMIDALQDIRTFVAEANGT